MTEEMQFIYNSFLQILEGKDKEIDLPRMKLVEAVGQSHEGAELLDFFTVTCLVTAAHDPEYDAILTAIAIGFAIGIRFQEVEALENLYQQS